MEEFIRDLDEYCLKNNLRWALGRSRLSGCELRIYPRSYAEKGVKIY